MKSEKWKITACSGSEQREIVLFELCMIIPLSGVYIIFNRIEEGSIPIYVVKLSVIEIVGAGSKPAPLSSNYYARYRCIVRGNYLSVGCITIIFGNG